MRLLIVGDSITEGVLGVSYVDLLEKALDNINIVNLGMGGDTILGIGKRAIAYLQNDNAFDTIIVEAGHNDIILPDFSQKSILHRLISFTRKIRGSKPAKNAKVFEKTYSRALQAMKEMTNTPIILTTLSCLNEDLSVDTNQTRHQYNLIIKKIAIEQNCIVADIGQLFDEILQEGSVSYFMDDLMSLNQTKQGQENEAANALSKARNLKLTIDGVHLNKQGAELYKNGIIAALKKYVQKSPTSWEKLDF